MCPRESLTRSLQAFHEDTVTFWAPEKVFFCLSYAKIFGFN